MWSFGIGALENLIAVGSRVSDPGGRGFAQPSGLIEIRVWMYEIILMRQQYFVGGYR